MCHTYLLMGHVFFYFGLKRLRNKLTTNTHSGPKFKKNLSKMQRQANFVWILLLNLYESYDNVGFYFLPKNCRRPRAQFFLNVFQQN